MEVSIDSSAGSLGDGCHFLNILGALATASLELCGVDSDQGRDQEDNTYESDVRTLP